MSHRPKLNPALRIPRRENVLEQARREARERAAAEAALERMRSQP